MELTCCNHCRKFEAKCQQIHQHGETTGVGNEKGTGQNVISVILGRIIDSVAARGFDASAFEKRAFQAVEVNECFEIVDDCLDLVDAADQEISLGLGDKKVGRAAHPEFLGFNPKLFFLELPGRRTRRDLLLCAIDFDVCRSHIQLNQLGEVAQGFFALIPLKKGPPVLSPGVAVQEGILEVEPDRDIVAVTADIAYRS